MKPRKIRFSSTPNGNAFHREIREAVNEYFNESDLAKYAPSRIWFKTGIMLAIYLVPFAFALMIFSETPGMYLLMFLVMAFGMVGIGMNISHEANHGAMAKSKKTNQLLGAVLMLIGIDQAIWQREHNVEHHTFTNIEGHDSDIAVPFLLRLSGGQKLRGIHRFQHIYAWLLYGLITFRWATFGDFMRFVKMKKRENADSNEIRNGILKLAGWKLMYHGYIWILPVVLLGIPLWQAIGAFLLMQFIAGILLGTVVQLAHIQSDCEFPLPENGETMESQWAVHQVATTCNFGTESKLLSWCVGGLNFQIEHHLFPNVSYYHLPALARIVEKAARKHGIPYHAYRSFGAAVLAHGRYLRQMGRQPQRKKSPKPQIGMSRKVVTERG